MRVIFGTYVREEDGRAFEYEATFERHDDDVAWTARVTCDGEYHGRSGGTIEYVGPLTDETIAEQVRSLVQASIRERAKAG